MSGEEEIVTDEDGETAREGRISEVVGSTGGIARMETPKCVETASGEPMSGAGRTKDGQSDVMT